MALRKNSSQVIWQALEDLGYSKHTAIQRAAIYENAAQASTILQRQKLNTDYIDVVIAGSRGEGVTSFLENDIDQVIVYKAVKCVEVCAVDKGDNQNVVKGDNQNVIKGDNHNVVEEDDQNVVKGDDQDAVKRDNQNVVKGDDQNAEYIKQMTIHPSTQDRKCKDITYDEITVFELETENVPAGYTYLRLEKLGTAGENSSVIMKTALTERDDHYYLSSEEIVTQSICVLSNHGWINTNIENQTRTGPSYPFHMKIPLSRTNSRQAVLSYDDVLALPCTCMTYVQAWCQADRKFDWPSKETIREISRLNAHVVPVGMKGSKDEKLQWRLSFTLAEIALVQSFNDTQIKLYALLKMLTKDILKQRCINLTSYMVKNIVFWVSESVPMSQFEQENFAERTKQALIYFKKCVEQEHLPNYMIPARNLLEQKMSQQERSIILEQLQELIFEGLGSEILLRCPKLKKVIGAGDPNEDIRMEQMREQVLLTTFSLPPPLLAEIMCMFHCAPSQKECVDIFVNKIIPHFRETCRSNKEFATALGVMTNEEMFELFFPDAL